ncbi:bifunctional glutamate/proline--tRNA ligase [Parasteatoda tepidariorum]|uniref:bifunctional glutamate/proline--tRNA ligase n=1 Tax=Parasteatoda tepidariorum TaxID=114398 RepID=UPI001C725C25|nr:bifunctional glutamate/proline--tRNA ligase [Parasteatoda tepidariorum]
MVELKNIKVTCTKSVSSLPILITFELTPSGATSIEYGNVIGLEIHRKPSTELINFTSVNSICRFLARQFAPSLYGSTILEKTEIDHWLETCSRKYSVNEFKDCVQKLDCSLVMVTFLVGDAITLADICVASTLFSNKQFHSMIADNTLPSNVKRWFSYLSEQPAFQKYFKMFPMTSVTNAKEKTEDKGKFVDLPGAEMGKVVVRFPPEASGFLHIGHAKAALLNAHYQTMFNGKLVFRFDDTNPEKEKEDFEKVILEDVALLQVKPDFFTYTSDHFDDILGKCESLIKNGMAYVDDTDPETMKNEREQRMESKNRNNDVAKNWSMWEEMKKGTAFGKTCCVRAKIDMKSDNGCLRDPTIYRCKDMPHPKTGNKYKVYPTYDFACPIVDSKEGVTHALRTTEYHDRDEQFFWFIDALKLRKLHIYEYSRLNMTNTVLSKRKLTWFVNEGYVDGWDDPRMPTVRGVLRRGMTVEGLKQFIVAQGSSRSVVVMEWDKIWAFNKKVIDPISPRYNAVEVNAVSVIVENAVYQELQVAKHPKNPELGTKTIFVGPKLKIDRFDAEAMKIGENVTFINWGNLLIKRIEKSSTGAINLVVTELNLENKDYKKTLKVTWVVDTENIPLTPCMCVYFNHLITKPVLGKDDDFKKYLNDSTKLVVHMLGDPDLAKLKKGDIIQIQRKGFFICDETYDPDTLRHVSVAKPVVLFSIPDGTKDTSSLPSLVKRLWYKEESEKEKIISMKGKDFERSPQDEGKGIIQTGVELLSKIKEQGDKVRKIKSDGASKETIGAEVKILMKLKEDFKNCMGMEWKPDIKLENPVSGNTVLKSNSSCTNSVFELDQQIRDQGDLVRKLKSQKADKAAIDTEVKKLLKLKTDFKACSNIDWKPDLKLDAGDSNTNVSCNSSGNADIISIDQQIKDQGNLVRKLKSEKADKAVIDTAVKKLLKLKEEFKACSKLDWKPDLKLGVTDCNTSTGCGSSTGADDVLELDKQIRAQGDVVRKLKIEKADKSIIDTEVKKLLKFKEDFKKVSNMDWKPDVKLDALNSKSCKEGNDLGKPSCDASNLDQQIRSQGDLVRKLKTEKAEKSVIDTEVKKLLKLKEEFKAVTNSDWKPDQKPNNPLKESTVEKQKKQNQKNNPAPKKIESKEEADGGLKKVTRLGLEVKKEDNLADWYSQVLTKSEMIEYYDVSGCYVLRPWAYSIWEAIQKFFDAAIKAMGVTNCYFPMFVSSNVLEKEKTHIADFAPEVAWVTKSGSSDLEKPIAIRPTSETVMYPSFARWIRSHRDLPLQVNQWCNVVRWEFSNPQPFIRTREFLWQEGHTAFASQNEAEKEVLDILELYTKVYEHLLAVPVIQGRKTEKEKFAGADFTTTVECYIAASGRGLQGGTSHHLGQNFSKMFEIMYEDPETNEKKFVYQNSWGLSTRAIGAMVMIHADNTGLVLPPRVALHQVVIVPCGITASLSQANKDTLLAKCKEFMATLQTAGIAVKGDFRDNYSPGWKFNDWELKGVPIRVEIGPKDLAKQQFVAVRRDTGEKITLKMDSAPHSVKELLDNIHDCMFAKAKKEMDEHVVVTYDFNDLCKKLNQKCIIMAPFCGDKECEGSIKKESAAKSAAEIDDPRAPSMGAKSLCIPFKQPAKLEPKTKCINPCCNRKPINFTLFGRSY